MFISHMHTCITGIVLLTCVSSSALLFRYSRGVMSPGRHVRTRLYFTSESHVHSLLSIFRYGGLLNVCSGFVTFDFLIFCRCACAHSEGELPEQSFCSVALIAEGIPSKTEGFLKMTSVTCSNKTKLNCSSKLIERLCLNWTVELMFTLPLHEFSQICGVSLIGFNSTSACLCTSGGEGPAVEASNGLPERCD